MYCRNYSPYLSSLSYWKGFFLLLFFYQNIVLGQCTNAAYGQFPTLNVTPNCNGVIQTITTVAKAGEYSKVVVFSDVNYTFSSSRAADYVTITNEDASVVLAHGITPISWDSDLYSGIIRYYLHNNSACQISTTARTKYIVCNETEQTLCYEPQALSITNVTINSALFSWNNVSPYPSQGYHYYISQEATPPNSNTVPTGIHFFDNVTLDNLKPNTTYYCWVRSSCYYDLHTNWMGISFTTLAGCNLESATLFPSTTFTPTCTGNNQVIVSNCYAGEYSNVSISANRLYTFTSSNANDYITITSSNGSIIHKTGQTPLTWLSKTSSTIRYYIHKFNRCETENVNRIRYIKCSSTSEYCDSPSSITVVNLTNQQADLVWNEPNPIPAEGYEIYRSTTNTTPTLFSTPVFISDDLSLTLTGLNSNTTYYTWVRSVCDNANKASWIQGPTFTTLATYNCPEPQGISLIDLTNYKAIIEWSTAGVVPYDGYDYYFSSSSVAPISSTNPTGEVNETRLVLNDLNESTTYYLWLRSKCSLTSKSAWVLFSFTTAAAPYGCVVINPSSFNNQFFSNYNCDGNQYIIATNSYAGSYDKIVVNPNKHFTFRTTVSSDYLTVTNQDNTVIYTSGITPLHWNSSSVVEIIRVYNHTNSSCGIENISRTKTISCDENLVLDTNDFDHQNLDIVIYPNPFSSVINIETTMNNFNYTMYSIEGKVIKKAISNENAVTVDLSSLNTGIYLLEIESNGSKTTRKIIKN